MRNMIIHQLLCCEERMRLAAGAPSWAHSEFQDQRSSGEAAAKQRQTKHWCVRLVPAECLINAAEERIFEAVRTVIPIKS